LGENFIKKPTKPSDSKMDADFRQIIQQNQCLTGQKMPQLDKRKNGTSCIPAMS
jgi:hypothetical protein